MGSKRRVKGTGPALVVERLAVTALAFPELKRRQRLRVLELGASVSVSQVRDFLLNGKGSRELYDIFGTTLRQVELWKALAFFDSTVRAWTGKRRRNPRYSWVMPRGGSSGVLREVVRSIDRLIEACIEASARQTDVQKVTRLRLQARRHRRLKARLQSSADVSAWMPFMSLEGCICLKHLGESDRNAILAVIARGMREFSNVEDWRPWTKSYPPELRAIPASWLYQFDPRRRIGIALQRLYDTGYTNVGHLVILHPDCWELARSTEVDQWVRIRAEVASQSS